MATAETALQVKQQKKAKDNAIIYGDLIEEILIRLPVHDLRQFRRVCKEWCTIIDKPHFIQRHLELAARHLLVFSQFIWASRSFYPPCAAIFDEKLDLNSVRKRAFQYCSHGNPTLVGSCNGLLCMYDEKLRIIRIVNPATGESLPLNKTRRAGLNDGYHRYGFGFHPTTNKYKVIHFPLEERYEGKKSFYHVDVIQTYTLGDNAWREIQAPNLRYRLLPGVINVDGAMFWLDCDTEEEEFNDCPILMSLDLEEERIITIKPPPFKAFESVERRHYVTQVDGMVCMAEALVAEENWRNGLEMEKWLNGLEMWVLENVREQRWSHKHTLRLQQIYSDVIHPHFIFEEKIVLKRAEFVPLKRTDCCPGGTQRNDYVCYQELGDVNVEIERDKEVVMWKFDPYRCLRCFIYVESLVPLHVYA